MLEALVLLIAKAKMIELAIYSILFTALAFIWIQGA